MADECLLDHIESGDVHDQLMLHMGEGETAEEAIQRLLDCVPYPKDQACRQCGRDITRYNDLAGSDWVAWRLRVEDSDRRRTDLFCSESCFRSAINGGLGRLEERRAEGD